MIYRFSVEEKDNMQRMDARLPAETELINMDFTMDIPVEASGEIGRIAGLERQDNKKTFPAKRKV